MIMIAALMFSCVVTALGLSGLVMLVLGATNVQ
jgi:hypothetical protein